MELNPRLWGRFAQAALAMLILSRVPYILGRPGFVEAAGATTGVVIGAYLVTALGRALTLTARRRWPSGEPSG